MPLTPLHIGSDLITKAHGGTAVTLNRKQYPEFERVKGEPSISPKNPAWDAAIREAFAALCVVRTLPPRGTRQKVFLGEEAIKLVYGRAKHENEQDCDVVGYGLSGKHYGYWLAEGKGDDLEKAIQQFEAVKPLLEGRRPDAARPDEPGPGLVCGGLIVTSRLRYLQWNKKQNAWLAWNGGAELTHVTIRLRANIERAKPTLQQDKVYLLDGPEGADHLPLWAITPGDQPWTVLTHSRGIPPGSKSDRGQFRPLRIGIGTLELYYVV